MNKLLEFQKRVEAIKKDSKNPFFKSNYFDINSLLAEIKPLLSELEIVLTQPIETRFLNDRVVNLLVTRIINVDNINEKENGKVLLGSEVLLPELQDPQKLGSAITYLRRYSLQTLLGLQAEDDDGNLASKQPVKQEVKQPVKETGNVYKLVLESCGTLAELQQAWLKVPVEEQTKELVALKDNLKTKLK